MQTGYDCQTNLESVSLLPVVQTVELALVAREHVAVFLVGAGLVGDGAAGLASGLAGCLAFAAAAVGQRVLQAGLLDGFDMLHSCNPPFLKKGYMGIIHDSGSNCNHFPEIFDTIAPIIPPVAVPIARSAKYAVHGAP